MRRTFRNIAANALHPITVIFCSNY